MLQPAKVHANIFAMFCSPPVFLHLPNIAHLAGASSYSYELYCTFHILYLVKGCGNSTFSYFREQVCKNFKNIRSFVFAKNINLQIG